MHIKTCDGVTLYIEKEGAGVPCIYLHGGPGYWSKSFQHFTSEFLHGQLEMIYLDQRGCGRSRLAENGDYSLERLIRDIEAVRSHLKIEEWYVMGHSFGGLLAVNYAHLFPEHTKGLILTNSTLNMADSFTHQILKGREWLGITEKQNPINDTADLVNTFYATAHQLIEENLFYKLQFNTPEDEQRLRVIDEALSPQPDFQQYIFSNEEYFQDFTCLTEKVIVPTFVLSGLFDHAVGPRHQESFQFPNGIYKQLESGHHPYVESPAEFSRAILEFILDNN
ncbi:alpha/beta fold hydrolase [Ornithinibacillus bavariensis]|uniref:alpha/beta fold hydrolase n=1 Tax=Ornithinibacillus bavariensis TaxID=545502 RepID=UPI000EDB9194|nr:alpha/beta hydrolase [Ornithinibacillus sp.]